MKKKFGIMKTGLVAMPLFLQDNLLSVLDSQPGKSCLDSDMKLNLEVRHDLTAIQARNCWISKKHKRRNTSLAKNSLYFLCTLQTIPIICLSSCRREE